MEVFVSFEGRPQQVARNVEADFAHRFNASITTRQVQPA